MPCPTVDDIRQCLQIFLAPDNRLSQAGQLIQDHASKVGREAP